MKHLMILVMFGLLALTGCKTKYVTVPEWHTEYICRTDTFAKVDSVHVKDSVFICLKGDTVYYNKVVHQDRYRNIYKVKTDTIIKHDSIPCPVMRELTKNEQRLMDMGRAAIIWIVCLAMLIILGLILIYRDYNRNKTC